MGNRSTQIVLGTLALLGFLAISALWWTGMHTGDTHNCIPALVQNGICPNAQTPDAAAFHVQTLQSFASNTLQSTVILLVAFVVMAAVTGLGSNPMRGVAVRREVDNAESPPEAQHRWLSLLEHSPSLSSGRT